PSHGENTPKTSVSEGETTQKSPSEPSSQIPERNRVFISLTGEMSLCAGINYAAYRLDLAKEIAVAMVAANWEPANIPRDAVDDANEIVKRLKETEE
ncbi:MAG: DUF4105 domain-containing protein, partial [Muribaculum sp.]|nr:DUF4105 domain-containing protein [Muribaculum sp.]